MPPDGALPGSVMKDVAGELKGALSGEPCDAGAAVLVPVDVAGEVEELASGAGVVPDFTGASVLVSVLVSVFVSVFASVFPPVDLEVWSAPFFSVLSAGLSVALSPGLSAAFSAGFSLFAASVALAASATAAAAAIFFFSSNLGMIGGGVKPIPGSRGRMTGGLAGGT